MRLASENPSLLVITTPRKPQKMNRKTFLRGSVIYRIPKASRNQLTFVLCFLITAVCEINTSWESWSLLRSLSYCLFKPNDQNIAKSPFLKLLSNESPTIFWMVPWEFHKFRGFLHRQGNLTLKRMNVPNSLNERWGKEEGDIKGAVWIISFDEQQWADTEETFRKLVEEHSDTHPNRNFYNGPSSQEIRVACTASQIRRAVLSFATGSASVPDLLDSILRTGWPSQAMKQPTNWWRLEALTCLCNLMLAGKAPEVVPFVYDASLFALSEANAENVAQQTSLYRPSFLHVTASKRQCQICYIKVWSLPIPMMLCTNGKTNAWANCV